MSNNTKKKEKEKLKIIELKATQDSLIEQTTDF